MKKIVALVLSLVMVLGLATTAFAAVGGNDLTAALDATNTNTVELKTGLTASASLKTFDTYQVFVTDKDKNVSVLPEQYVKVPSKLNATYVVVDGSKITYLAVNPQGAYTDVAKAVTVAFNADPECGDVYVADEAKAGTYYLYKGEYYVEGSRATCTTYFNVDGVAVWAEKTTDVKTFAHDYKADYAKVAGKDAITKVYCAECKATFAFVEGEAADAVAKFGAGKYDVTTVAPAVTGNVVYVAKTAGVAAVDGDKVESAETFDAGIAMYVGMSVMAAAGSAVVLKKKD